MAAVMLEWPALTGAYVLDLVAGDPRSMPHPVVLMARLARAIEGQVRPLACSPVAQLAGGALIVTAVVGLSAVAGWLLLEASATLSHAAELLVAVVLGWTTLATRSLLEHAAAVLGALDDGDLPRARAQVARIVGRDTEGLDESGVARAVIETVAESSSDGIVAPLLYLTLGGPPLALAYKAVNTLDSMIGHREPPYLHLGRVAARLDDLANLVPARLTALLIVVAALLTRRSCSSAWRVWRRDGGKHASPNAGQPEAAMAGALGVRLGGVSHYDGQPADRALLGAELPMPGRRAAGASLRIAGVVSFLAFLVALATSLVGGVR
jgi:adenosylcobinamide-phosphate synthase